MTIALVFGLVLAANPAPAATTFTVDSTRDEGGVVPGDGVCDSDPRTFVVRCTLRAAIEEANATGGADTINFGIDEGGIKTIEPATRLPAITAAVTIDGYSQPGARPNSQNVGTNAILKIQLSGASAGNFKSGLFIDVPKTVVKVLVINRFGSRGIFVQHDGTSTAIQGNFIGTDPGGTLDLGNSTGVVVNDPADTIIGGSTPEARNLISGNDLSGVLVATGATVQGDLIGTDKNGTSPLGNSNNGVVVRADINSVEGNTSEFSDPETVS